MSETAFRCGTSCHSRHGAPAAFTGKALNCPFSCLYRDDRSRFGRRGNPSMGYRFAKRLPEKVEARTGKDPRVTFNNTQCDLC